MKVAEKFRKRMNDEGIDTVGCKANMLHKINRKVCRNNCKNWEHTGKRKGICELGLN